MLERRKIPETLKHTTDVKFSELCTDAILNAEHENGDSAIRNLKGVIAALSPAFGDRSAASITTPELLAWLRKQCKAKEWADGTYNHYIVQLCVIYRVGQENNKVSINPARGLKHKELDNDKPRYLTSDETERLESVLQERWPQHIAAYLFARNTGLRAGAQFWLKWAQVDMHARTVTLPNEGTRSTKKTVCCL